MLKKFNIEVTRQELKILEDALSHYAFTQEDKVLKFQDQPDLLEYVTEIYQKTRHLQLKVEDSVDDQITKYHMTKSADFPPPPEPPTPPEVRIITEGKPTR